MNHLALIFALFVATTPAQAALDTSPRGFVGAMADEVIAILDQDNLSGAEKIQKIEIVADRRFHFPSISRLVVARNWRKMSSEQKRTFNTEFQKHLSVTYGKNVNRFEDQTIEISDDREEPRGDWTVKTRIVQPRGEDVLVDYRLRKIEGRWRVIDVVVEHISLVSNFRSQIQELISKQGIDGTLIFLAEKNASGQSILPGEETEPPD